MFRTLVMLCLVVQIVDCRRTWLGKGQYGRRSYSSYLKRSYDDIEDHKRIIEPQYPRQLLLHRHLKVVPLPWSLPRRKIIPIGGSSQLFLHNILSVLGKILPQSLRVNGQKGTFRKPQNMAVSHIQRKPPNKQSKFVNVMGQIQVLRVPNRVRLTSNMARTKSNRPSNSGQRQVEAQTIIVNTNGQQQVLRIPTGIKIERNPAKKSTQTQDYIRDSLTRPEATQRDRQQTQSQGNIQQNQDLASTRNLNGRTAISAGNTNRQNRNNNGQQSNRQNQNNNGQQSTGQTGNINEQRINNGQQSNSQTRNNNGQQTNRQNIGGTGNTNRQNSNGQSLSTSGNNNRPNLNSQNTARNTLPVGNANNDNVNSNGQGRLNAGNTNMQNNQNTANLQTDINQPPQNGPNTMTSNSQNTASPSAQNSLGNSNTANNQNGLERINTNSQMDTIRVLRETGWFAEVSRTPALYQQILRASRNPRIAQWIQRIAETNLMEEFIGYVDAFTILTATELSPFQMEFIMRLGGNDLLQDYLIDPSILQMVLNYVRSQNHIDMMATIAEVDVDEFLINDPPLFAQFLNNALTVGQTDVIQSFARKGYLLGLLRIPETLFTILQYSRDTANSQFIQNLSETGGIQQVIDSPGLLPGVLQQ